MPVEPPAERGPLIEWLVRHGASGEEIEAAAGDGQLELLAGEVALRVSRPSVSLREAADRVGRPLEEVRAVWRAAGFVERDPDAPVLAEEEVEGFFRVLSLALDVFGLEATLGLARVLSSATGTVADALVSQFHTSLGLAAARADPSGVALGEAAVMAGAPLPALGRAVELLLRRQIVGLMRPLVSEADGASVDAVRVAVGFVDLVSFTARTREQSLEELDAVIRGFNELAHATVTRWGGRLVKMIGDEVMFVSQDPQSGCEAALDLLERLSSMDLQGRAGLAWGPVLTREGDYFGVPVNLAARITSVAQPGTVVAASDVVDAMSDPNGGDLAASAETTIELRGFGAVAVREIRRSDRPPPAPDQTGV